MQSFYDFSIRAFTLGANHEKQVFTFFCLFTPLYGRFMLCRASQTIDIEKIYRLVSKILNFMAYGSVLDRFCVQCKNFVAWASKIYRNFIEILWRCSFAFSRGTKNRGRPLGFQSWVGGLSSWGGPLDQDILEARVPSYLGSTPPEQSH